MDYNLGYMPHCEGDWAPSTTYTPMSIVRHNNISYIAKVGCPENMEPGISFQWGDFWQILTEGSQGSSGTNGTNGTDGAQGTQGVKGDTGETGTQGAQGTAGHSPANTEVWSFKLAGGNTLTRTIYMVPTN